MAEPWRSRIVGYDQVDPRQLVANPANWRTHPDAQRGALEGVLGEVGWVSEVLVNQRTGFVVDGHLRVAAAVAHGEPSVPVRYVDLDVAEERLVLATLDPISALASSDGAQLAALLDGLQPADQAVANLLRELVPPQPKALNPDDADLTPPEEPVTQRGDLWLLGEHRLLCGDATCTEDVARVMAGERADVMATDPPYGVSNDLEWRGRMGLNPMGANRSGKVANDERADWTSVWQLAPTDVAYVWHASAHVDEVMVSLRDAGFEPRQQIIWVKTIPIISRSAYNWQHEPCWYAVRHGRTAQWRGGFAETTVWSAPSPNHIMSSSTDGKTEHPTQKPVAIFEPPLRNHTGVGGLAYEPFAGSGTAIIAAEQLHRRCYAIDIEPAYCDVIVRRWETVTGGTAVKADA